MVQDVERLDPERQVGGGSYLGSGHVRTDPEHLSAPRIIESRSLWLFDLVGCDVNTAAPGDGAGSFKRPQAHEEWSVCAAARGASGFEDSVVVST